MMTYMKVRSGTGGIKWELSGGGKEIGVIICVQVCNWFTQLQPEWQTQTRVSLYISSNHNE